MSSVQTDEAKGSEETDALRNGSGDHLIVKAEGSIMHSIPNFASMGQKVSTPMNVIGGLPWKLSAEVECSERTDNVKFLSVYADCNPESESTLWTCDATVEFRLVSYKPEILPFSRQLREEFGFKNNHLGFMSFIRWDEIFKPENGYIDEGAILLEAHIAIRKVSGIRDRITFDFMSSRPYICDATLVIGGERVHVNKAYLALHSPFFHALFFSNFSERDQKEIPIEDVSREEFVELLNVIYPSRRPVSEANVEFLLKLSDRFEVPYVTDECEHFLELDTNNFDYPVVKKLLWAERYALGKLHDACIRGLNNPKDVKALKNAEGFESLTDGTKLALFERLLKLV